MKGCKGLCEKLRVRDRLRVYALGVKYCRNCSEFILWDGIRCPCCGLKLRLKSRSKRCPLKYLYL